jgi:hypothetical protein
MKTKMSSGKVALVATVIALVGLTQIPSVFADTATRKNSDGSVDVYDQDDPNAPQGDGQETVQGDGGAVGGGGGIRYVPGTSPYTKKYSDGTVVRRNSDGSIETSDPGETSYWGSQASTGGSGARRARSRKRVVKPAAKTVATKKAATSTAKKAK